MAFCSSGSVAAEIDQLGVARLAEVRVVVERDLAIERDDIAGRDLRQRVDLDESGVGTDERIPQRDEDVRDLVGDLSGKMCGRDDLACLRIVHSGDGVDGHLGQRVRAFYGELLDLHAALVGRHREERAVGTVQEVGDVVLLLDLGAGVDEHAVHRVPLDVHPEDLLGRRSRVVGRLGDLHTACLAAATDLDLRLDHRDAAEAFGDRSRFVRCGRDLAEAHGDTELLEQLLCLVLEQVHRSWSVSRGWDAGSSLGQSAAAEPAAETRFTGLRHAHVPSRRCRPVLRQG